MIVESRIPFKLDRRARWLTVIWLVAIAGVIVALYYTSGGSYLPAWFSTLVVALFLLACLSAPRFVHISPHSVEIHCAMELIKIPIRDIKEVRHLDSAQMRHSVPLLGIYGMLGYYGYYFNFDDRKIFRLYASQWRNFVVIEDIYEEQIVVSCPDPDEFIKRINSFM